MYCSPKHWKLEKTPHEIETFGIGKWNSESETANPLIDVAKVGSSSLFQRHPIVTLLYWQDRMFYLRTLWTRNMTSSTNGKDILKNVILQQMFCATSRLSSSACLQTALRRSAAAIAAKNGGNSRFVALQGVISLSKLVVAVKKGLASYTSIARVLPPWIASCRIINAMLRGW